MTTLQREVFETSRELEYFSEKELRMQLGYQPAWWPVTIAKELIDNALDAAEAAGVAPELTVEVDKDGFSIQDNGPGMPAEVVGRSLDYLVRVSDKSYYIAPTRGQLGNALKAIYAAGFVDHGQGEVTIEADCVAHHITLDLDRLAQKPRVTHETAPSVVRNGTKVAVAWPDCASSLGGPDAKSYNQVRVEDQYYPEEVPSLRSVLLGFAAVNPHARIAFGELVLEPTSTAWKKWLPTDPTSAHWYDPDQLRQLMAGYVTKERNGTTARTVRAFVSEFRGLSATAKQKAIGYQGEYLRDFVSDGDLDMGRVAELLAKMQAESNPVQPASLGIIGQDHMTRWMLDHAHVNAESVKYVRRVGFDERLPHVLEVAYGIRGDDDGRLLVPGLNWSYCLTNPLKEAQSLLQAMRMDEDDPLTVIIHIARPMFEFVDRSKTRVQL